MVKFKDLNNDHTTSSHPSRPKNGSESKDNSRLSFRKLADESKAHSEETVVSEGLSSENVLADESGKVLYQKAVGYLEQVLEAVKQGKMFSLDPGFQIIREMVEMQSFQDSLFIEALHFDDPLQFIINNNINVAIYAIKMAENLNWGKNRQIEIGMAGLFHDVGMVLIPEKLLYKQQRLSEEELQTFRKRSDYSYRILKSCGTDFPYLAESAAQANERLDGSGYPLGLKGDEIHEYAQVIGLVDFYEALIHSRPQREKFLHFIAVKEIIKTSKHLFQRRHLKALLNIFSIFPLYSYVKLNSNAIGRVIQTYPDLPMRPKIQIVYDSQQRKVLTERIVNLPDDPLLYLVDSVSDEELQQLSERSERDTGVKVDFEKKEPESGPAEVDTATVADELPADPHAKELQKDRRKKSGRFKTVLIIAAIILLAGGFALKYLNRNTASMDVVKRQPTAVRKVSKPVNAKKPEAVDSVSREKQPAPKDADPAKAIASQISDIKGSDLRSESMAPPPMQLNAAPDKTTAAGKPVGANRQKIAATASKQLGDLPGKTTPLEDPDFESKQVIASTVLPAITAVPEVPSKNTRDTAVAKRLYPFSIKLDAFRTLERVAKSLEDYRQKNLSPYWVKVDLGDKGVWYRIFFGFFKDTKQAQKVIDAHRLSGAEVKKTRYAVLIGSYSHESEVNKQIRLLSSQGFSPYILNGAKGEFYLYVGAFYTEAGAQNQSDELLSKSFQNTVVERFGTERIDQPAESEPDMEGADVSYPYSVKLTYFRSRAAAENSLSEYRHKGLSPYWVKVNLGDQGIWYRVFTGYFEDIAGAREIVRAHNLKGALIKKTKYAALIGTYRSETDAGRQMKLISNRGFSPYTIKSSKDEINLYVGAFYTRKGAEEQHAELLAGGIESKVVER